VGPKSGDGGRGRGRDDKFFGEFLIELEDHIKDYILEEKTDDVYLNQYMQLVFNAEASGQPILSGPSIDMPDLFINYVVRYIKEGFQERAKVLAPPATEGGA
jgi:hypothetical protein